MTKSELIAQVADAAGTTKAHAERAYGAVVDVIKNVASKGGEVKLADLGTFRISERTGRPGRNPKTGASIAIPASKTVTFRPAASLKRRANGS